MGLLDKLFGSSEPAENVWEIIENSECGQLFASHFIEALNPGGDDYQWLMQNSKERMIKPDFFKEGVRLTYVEVNPRRNRETGTYDVDVRAIGFGASGFADLPKSSYVHTFRSFILKSIEKNCPNIELISDGAYLKLKASALKGW